MAIIKCPECGRERVSSIAETCPDCGYPIKQHFQDVTKEDNTDTIQSESKNTTNLEESETFAKKAQAIRCTRCKAIYSSDMPYCPTCGIGEVKDIEIRCTKCKTMYPANMSHCPSCGANKAKEENTQTPTSNVATPERPTLSKGFLIYEIVATVLLILMFNSNPFALFLEIFCFVILPAIIYLSNYFKKVQDYDLAQNNPQAYQKKLQDEAKARQARAEAERIRLQNAPKCPHCNSTDIEKITTMDRGISIAMVGLASGKIGKQYKCKKCKHMW